MPRHLLHPAFSSTVAPTALAELRQQIERLEGGSRTRKTLPFGIAAVDDHLPGGGLMRGAVHEVVEAGPVAEFAGSATLFTAGIAARLNGPVLWCLTRRDLFAPGLANAGLPPSRVIYAEAGRDRDVLPLVEEGLREHGLAAVIGEVTRLSLTASRRLQLAAEGSGVTALILRRWWTVAEKDLSALPSAAITRWRIAPTLSEPVPAPGLGRAQWQVDLMRCRSGVPRSWILEACDASGHLALASARTERPSPAGYPAAGFA
ncbi:MAG: damage-inducible mutagenesis protein [Pseudomonadota bacterium]|jgi:protein ImuA|nr:damage-inducible mutagenesis protein [Pseudomonadota bacterium]